MTTHGTEVVGSKFDKLNSAIDKHVRQIVDNGAKGPFTLWVLGPSEQPIYDTLLSEHNSGWDWDRTDTMLREKIATLPGCIIRLESNDDARMYETVVDFIEPNKMTEMPAHENDGRAKSAHI